MSEAYELRKRHADALFGSLEGLRAGTIELLARALMLGGGSLCGFGEALELTARFPEPSLLARIRMAVELGRLAHAAGCDELLERLSDATDAPWPVLRLALFDLRTSELAAGV